MNTKEKIKEIRVEHGLRKEILKTFNTTYPTIKTALSFQSDTENARMIRGYALNHGGILVESINK